MTKRLIVGADEAGYGPNLGPLVVAATLWEVPGDLQEAELCAAMAQDFAPLPWKPNCQHVPLGDSKKLYKSGSGLHSLEAGLLALLAQTGSVPEQFRELRAAVAPQASAPLKASRCPLPPWYALADALPIPRDLDRSERARLGAGAGQALQRVGVRLLDIRAVIVDEVKFNSSLERLGSKGQLLSQTTLQLVARLLTRHEGDAEVFCDRQGGRTNYLPVLLDAFPDDWFGEVASSPARSSYRTQSSRDLAVHFSVGGDRLPPTALASMLAKYLRERMMEAFNTFWIQQLPGLKPTAGYPVDAQRFRDAIADRAVRLQLPPDSWWRRR